jgi:hypothetical protein
MIKQKFIKNATSGKWKKNKINLFNTRPKNTMDMKTE